MYIYTRNVCSWDKIPSHTLEIIIWPPERQRQAMTCCNPLRQCVTYRRSLRCALWPTITYSADLCHIVTHPRVPWCTATNQCIATKSHDYRGSKAPLAGVNNSHPLGLNWSCSWILRWTMWRLFVLQPEQSNYLPAFKKKKIVFMPTPI